MQERIYKNYNNIEFRPQNFTHYLLSSEIGFYKCEVVSIPSHPFKGFQRPLHLFTKPGEQSNDVTLDHCEGRESFSENDKEIMETEEAEDSGANKRYDNDKEMIEVEVTENKNKC